mgnify:CR=1 FL=1
MAFYPHANRFFSPIPIARFLWLLSFACCLPGNVFALKAVSLGSFHQERNAEEFEGVVRAELGEGQLIDKITVGIVSASSPRGTLFRVVALPKDANEKAKDLVAVFNSLGLTGGWLVQYEDSLNSPIGSVQKTSDVRRVTSVELPIDSSGPNSQASMSSEEAVTENDQPATNKSVDDQNTGVLKDDKAKQPLTLPTQASNQRLAVGSFVRFDHNRSEGSMRSRVGADIDLGLYDVSVQASLLPDFFEQAYDPLLFNSDLLEPFNPETRTVFKTAGVALDSAAEFDQKAKLDFAQTTQSLSSSVPGIFLNEATPIVKSVYTPRIGHSFSYTQHKADGTLVSLVEQERSSIDGILFSDTGDRTFRYIFLGASLNRISHTPFTGANEGNGSEEAFSYHSLSYGQIPSDGFKLTYTGASRDRKSYDSANHELALYTANKTESLTSLSQIFVSRRAGVAGLGGRVKASIKQGDSISHLLRFTAMDSGINLNDVGFLSRNNFSEVTYSLAYAPKKSIEGLIYPLFGARKPLARLAIENPGLSLTAYHRRNGPLTEKIGEGLKVGGFLTGVNGERLFTNFGLFSSRLDRLGVVGPKVGDVSNRFWYELGVSGFPLGSIGFDLDLLVGRAQEYGSSWSTYSRAGLRYTPSGKLSLRAGLDLTRRNAAALLRPLAENLITRSFTSIKPSLNASWRFTNNQVISYDFQWLGLDPEGPPDFEQIELGHSQMTSQLRYELEFAKAFHFSLLYSYGVFLLSDQPGIDPSLISRYGQTLKAQARDNYFSARLHYLLQP